VKVEKVRLSPQPIIINEVWMSVQGDKRRNKERSQSHWHSAYVEGLRIMSPSILFLGLLFLGLNLAKGSYGKVSAGHISTREDWVFIDRFCFLSLDGLFEYEIQYDSVRTNQIPTFPAGFQ